MAGETACCDFHDPAAVYYNPFNGVVQCHNCGTVYLPVAALTAARREGWDAALGAMGEAVEGLPQRHEGDEWVRRGAALEVLARLAAKGPVAPSGTIAASQQ